MEQKLVSYADQILKNNKDFGQKLHVSTPAELAEKLAFRAAKVVLDTTPENNSAARYSRDEIEVGIKTGDLDRIAGAAESIYRVNNPDSNLPLMDEIFNSLIQTGKL